MSSLTIVLPTFNRAPFLDRLLGYYAAERCPFAILVADSSREEERAANARAVERARGAGLVVEHRVYPSETGLSDKAIDALGAVTTPLCVMAADDDFFTVGGLARAAACLEERPDVAVAHGEAAWFSTEDGGARGAVTRVWRYPQRALEQARAADRLVEHFRDYNAIWYSVQRTAALREAYGAAVGEGLDFRFLEYVPSALALVAGKAVKLPGLYMVRQQHQAKVWEIPSAFYWIIEPGFAEQYRRARALVAGRLAAADGMDGAAAEKVFDEAFSLRIAYAFAHAFPSGLERAKGRIGMALSRVSVIRRAWREVKGRLDPLSVDGLRARRSPYWREFAPIFAAVAQ